MGIKKDSEFRLYGYIEAKLKEVGWNVKSPRRGGQVYTQNEALQHDKLKMALGLGRPENIVAVGEGDFWVIEAKADIGDLSVAIDEAKGRAQQINGVDGIGCKMVTGVAGIPDTTHYVETHCLTDSGWKPLIINSRQSTGFISPAQASAVLESNNATLSEYEIDDKLFLDKITSINKILHNGAIHKRKRAEVLACMLLALANDPKTPLSDDPGTLIKDINNRAEGELSKHGKGRFFKEIQISLPVSHDNHIKTGKALSQSLEMLRDLNVASTIGSGRDVIGQSYEQFLKYANDAKEIGIVLTPRHITDFGVMIVDVQKNDVVLDPTCGTGGFLVSALDKVRKDGADIDNFQKGNLYGTELDAFIATLAIVNMVFRGDGSSHIVEGDCLQQNYSQRFDKVLMNPPFALEEPEWQFVDKALESMRRGGLLFAVLPPGTMNSSKDARREKTWRKNLLKRHTLITVIKLSEQLFYPHVSKGTYGVVIKAHIPHKLTSDKVLWGVLNDGMIRTKTQRTSEDNSNLIVKSVRDFISTQTIPPYARAELDCTLIKADRTLNLSPEYHIGSEVQSGRFEIESVVKNMREAREFVKRGSTSALQPLDYCELFPLEHFFKSIERGKSGKKKDMKSGKIPLISTTEGRNGISSLVDGGSVSELYPKRSITVSANGSGGYAAYHEYEFAATQDVHVCVLEDEFNDELFGVFLCAAINEENWRTNYYSKLSGERLKGFLVKIPVTKVGDIDRKVIKKVTKNAGG